MASSLQAIQKEVKQSILTDYLSGMEIEEIKKKYGFKHIRTCYYHLQPLSSESKMLHMLNKAKRLQESLNDENNPSDQ